jgi:hypothetical protein
MKSACGTWFAIYLSLAGAVGAIVYRRFPEPTAAAIAGAIGGGVLWMAIGYFWGIGQKVRATQTIRDAYTGVPPVDGEKLAAIGRIEPTGSPLISPFSKTACVAYKYEMQSGYGNRVSTHYSGFALTPSAVQTPRGSIKLLAWADIDKAVKATSVPNAAQNAREYFAGAGGQFSEASIANISQALHDMMAMYRDDDGSVKWDQMGTPQNAADFDGATYREWLLHPGEQVCVTGTYSTARGGIVPSKQPLMDPVTIAVGPPEAFAGRATAGGVGYFIGGLIFTALAAIALIAFFTFIPIEASEQMSPSMKVTWPELKLERFIDKRVRTKLREMGMLNAADFVSVSLPAGEATGKVRGNGQEETVSRAMAVKTGDGWTISVDEHAVNLVLGPNSRPEKLSILGQEVPVEEASIQILDHATGRITYVTDDRACHVTYHAGE